MKHLYFLVLLLVLMHHLHAIALELNREPTSTLMNEEIIYEPEVEVEKVSDLNTPPLEKENDETEFYNTLQDEDQTELESRIDNPSLLQVTTEEDHTDTSGPEVVMEPHAGKPCSSEANAKTCVGFKNKAQPILLFRFIDENYNSKFSDFNHGYFCTPSFVYEEFKNLMEEFSKNLEVNAINIHTADIFLRELSRFQTVSLSSFYEGPKYDVKQDLKCMDTLNFYELGADMQMIDFFMRSIHEEDKFYSISRIRTFQIDFMKTFLRHLTNDIFNENAKKTTTVEHESGDQVR